MQRALRSRRTRWTSRFLVPALGAISLSFAATFGIAGCAAEPDLAERQGCTCDPSACACDFHAGRADLCPCDHGGGTALAGNGGADAEGDATATSGF